MFAHAKNMAGSSNAQSCQRGAAAARAERPCCSTELERSSPLSPHGQLRTRRRVKHNRGPDGATPGTSRITLPDGGPCHRSTSPSAWRLPSAGRPSMREQLTSREVANRPPGARHVASPTQLFPGRLADRLCICTSARSAKVKCKPKRKADNRGYGDRLENIVRAPCGLDRSTIEILLACRSADRPTTRSCDTRQITAWFRQPNCFFAPLMIAFGAI